MSRAASLPGDDAVSLEDLDAASRAAAADAASLGARGDAVSPLEGRRGARALVVVALLIGAVLLASVPPASAAITSCSDVSIPVADTLDRIWEGPDTFPRCYGFDLTDPPFNTTSPIDIFAVESNVNVGEYTAEWYVGFEKRVLARTIAEYVVSNDTDSVKARVETYLWQKNLIGLTLTPPGLRITQEVYYEGELKWQETNLVGFRTVDFLATANIGWAKDNLTAYTTPTGGDIGGEKATTFAQQPPSVNLTNTIFYVPYDYSGRWWEGTGNGTDREPNTVRLLGGTPMFTLAQMPDVRSVSVVMTHEGVEPSALSFHYMFLTKGAREARSADITGSCGFIATLVQNVFGFCPSVEGMVTFMAGHAATFTANLLGVVPGLGELSEGAGTLAGILIGLYVFGLGLIVLDPVRLVTVWMGHVIFYALLFAGFQREPRLVFIMFANGMKLGGKLAWYYVAATFYLLKFAYEIVSRLAHVVVQAVRG